AEGGSGLRRPQKAASDQPLLNRRSEQQIGKVATLTEPIKDGQGRVRIGDTIWRVTGPDLPAGAQVRVTAATAAGLELVVEAVKGRWNQGGFCKGAQGH